MSRPLSADALVSALRAEGVTVVEHDGWRTHNRDAKGPWGPVNGVMIHHTVSSGTDASVRLCYDGHSELPGPLCHGVIAKDGTVHLVGNGRANHAGGGDPSVLQAVITETYGDRPPAPHQHEGSAGAVDGNTRFYGFECVNLGDGHDPWPAEQLDAIERVSAALCRAHGWGAKSVIGHLEWSDWKVDPRGFSMTGMRRRVQSRLSTGRVARATHHEAHQEPRPPRHQPYPGASFFRAHPHSPIVTAMGHRLVAEGCGHYRVGPGPQWTEADRESYAAWQRKLGFRGADADGWPGPTSWAALKVPYSA
ncbi:peptidoglycan-binding protein [Streptomyces beihaiensis]|uniref:Peptidoglycan-binding protein n=1 Tax=Streptomyces beihaiensis TaxID=2984495 RepID=A0ABT3TXU9_9ACTN|nr:peptidoglycan-binding protein [Streptomyces beihaiensis]MCX3061868.1 peptidoglycan-binding protein [Streptomyces beihaiensis]